MEAGGWRLKAKKGAISEEMIAKYELEINDTDYLLKDLEDQDRIQRGLTFCQELIRLNKCC